jgi:hypothetical protein
MRIFFVVIICLFSLYGCSSSKRGIAPTCIPFVGMSEEKFIDCACVCPLLTRKCSIELISSTKNEYGTINRFNCVSAEGNIVAVFTNGTLESVTKMETYIPVQPYNTVPRDLWYEHP